MTGEGPLASDSRSHPAPAVASAQPTANNPRDHAGEGNNPNPPFEFPLQTAPPNSGCWLLAAGFIGPCFCNLISFRNLPDTPKYSCSCSRSRIPFLSLRSDELPGFDFFSFRIFLVIEKPQGVCIPRIKLLHLGRQPSQTRHRLFITDRAVGFSVPRFLPVFCFHFSPPAPAR